MTASFFAAFAATLLAAGPVAFAQPLPDGRYLGVLQVDNRPMPVVLNLGATPLRTESGATLPGNSLRFEQPWSCTLSVTYADTQAGLRTYSLGHNEGPCRRLSQGSITLHLTAAGYAAELIRHREQKPLYTLTLTPPIPAAPATMGPATPGPATTGSETPKTN